MKIIKKNEPFGNTFLSWQVYSDDGSGLRVVCPSDGDYIVRNEADKSLHRSTDYPDGVISRRRGLLQRGEDNRFSVFFYSLKPIRIKGFVLIAGRDNE